MVLLHVDTDVNFCQKIKQLVENNGFIYRNTSSYESAYNILVDSKIDVLVIRDSFGDEDCSDMIKKIRLLEYPLSSVIVVGEDYDYTKKEAYFDLGVMSYISKEPFIVNRFEQYIRTVKMSLELLKELRTLRIAVVDDSAFSISVIKRYFEMHDIYNVVYFQDSEEFLNSEDIYDIYLLDYVMPKFDGEDLIYKIREENFDSMIILVTAHDNQKTIGHCLAIGADDYIMKPLDAKLFILRIISGLNKLRIKQENINNNKMLFELATKDQLTGLCNRNYFVDMYNKKVSEALRNKHELSFILLDIDNFKAINDIYGHLAGDYVLKALSDVLKSNLRAADTICRWGGEEFLIMCSDTSLEKAIVVAEKLRKAVEEYLFDEVGSVTVSLGITEWRERDDEKAVFKRADRALYIAKRNGKNRIYY